MNSEVRRRRATSKLSHQTGMRLSIDMVHKIKKLNPYDRSRHHYDVYGVCILRKNSKTTYVFYCETTDSFRTLQTEERALVRQYGNCTKVGSKEIFWSDFLNF